MEWYKRLMLYSALGFVTFKMWEVTYYFKEQIDPDEE